jgi:hypothetical protein
MHLARQWFNENFVRMANGKYGDLRFESANVMTNDRHIGNKVTRKHV